MGNYFRLEIIKFFVIGILIFSFQIPLSFAQTKCIAKMLSPDKKYRVEFFFQDSALCYFLKDNKTDTLVIKTSKIGFVVDTLYSCVTLSDTLEQISKHKYSSIIENPIGEKRFQEDEYSSVSFSFKNYGLSFQVVTRLYNRAFAVRYILKSKNKHTITSENTAINLSGLNLVSYCEYRVEDGYRANKGDIFNNLTPLFITDCNRNFSATINEAANYANASKMRVYMKKNVYTFNQDYYKDTLILTPWRYIVFGNNPIEMLENKYVIYSLNNCDSINKYDFSWVEPGTVYRYMPNSYQKETIRATIDFCKENSIKYLLFDAGWYGDENSQKSNPIIKPNNFDISKTVEYAREKNVRIMLYVNQLAWNTYGRKRILDTMKSWGIAGVKLGFMTSRSQFGLRGVYAIVREAAKREIVLNIHDIFRPTGTEFFYRNLLTSEGIRGNEYTDNDAYHTMLLPFTRFMTGAADYTICFPGYPENMNGKVSKMVNSKCHQMALSVIYFSALQHIFWYGLPQLYTKKEEIEFFNNLPTVWDDFKIIDGYPGHYFTIVRKSENKWYLASACLLARELNIDFSFLDKKKSYKITIYEDGENKTVKKTCLNGIKNTSIMNFPLKNNGGIAAIIEME